jgi:hypothetical protein
MISSPPAPVVDPLLAVDEALVLLAPPVPVAAVNVLVSLEALQPHHDVAVNARASEIPAAPRNRVKFMSYSLERTS